LPHPLPPPKIASGSSNRHCKFAGLDFDWEYPANATQAENYIALLSEMRAAFTPHNLQLTAAVSAEQLNLCQIGEAVDYLNLMSYDHDGRHATLEDAHTDVKKLLDAKVPAGKITLGVPFYARGIHERSRMLGYGQVVDSFHPAPDVNEVDNLYFNGPNLIRQKTEYAIANKLAGIMIWELAFDSPGEYALLPVIQKTIADNNAKSP
jgi:GH18 family chitinase